MEKPSRTSTEGTTLRLVLLSDTHQLHREVDVPDGDICRIARCPQNPATHKGPRLV
jgi:hypothetical protein